MMAVTPGGGFLSDLLYGQDLLEVRCAERSLEWEEYAPMNEFHGNASILKRVAGLPDDDPLPFAVEHAIPFDLRQAYDYDLKCGLPLFLAVNEASAALYRGGPIPRVESIGYTYLYTLDLFASLHPGQSERHRIGTIVFPDKSTLLMDTDFDRDRFAARLAELPAEYQPVVVCVYWRDYLRGNHLAFVKAGLQVVSCGHLRDADFQLRLHDLCRRFRYACANDIAGSFVLSILSGCHFFHLSGGPLTQSKHGVTGTFERDPTLDLPEKTACLAAAPFPPTDPALQRRLALRLAGADRKRRPDEITALAREAREKLCLQLRPCEYEVDGSDPALWVALRPRAIDPDGWMKPGARLRLTAVPGIGAIRLTLDQLPPTAEELGPPSFEFAVDGGERMQISAPPYRCHLSLPLAESEGEIEIAFFSEREHRLPRERRHRTLRLARVELLETMPEPRQPDPETEPDSPPESQTNPPPRRSALRRFFSSHLRKLLRR